LRHKFDPPSDDGSLPRVDPERMITNSLEVAATAAAAHSGEAAITVRDVRKSYGSLQALDGVDLTVRRGEVLALLGPNGAGKTTLTEILEGHRSADAGELDVLGHDPALRERALRERIGIVLQETGLDPTITVREAIELYGAAFPNPRPWDEVAGLVGMLEHADKRTETLSGGQRRRLDLALGICGDPELIFLDEPTTGFDPAARRQSWELIEGLRSLGKTILLTTHYMDEAQHLADRVVVIAGGRIIAEGTPETLGRGSGDASLVSFRVPAGLDGDDMPLPLDAVVEQRGSVIQFSTATPTRDLAPLLSWAAVRGAELEALTVARPSLEDVYLQLTRESR
jgi:ABC-2 type transport system ATP-binding protein